MKGEKGAEEREELKKEMMRKMILGGDLECTGSPPTESGRGGGTRRERDCLILSITQLHDDHLMRPCRHVALFQSTIPLVLWALSFFCPYSLWSTPQLAQSRAQYLFESSSVHVRLSVIFILFYFIYLYFSDHT